MNLPATWAEAAAAGLLTARSDGPDRYDVTDSGPANRRFGCRADSWCIVQDRHPGPCSDDRETWVEDPETPGHWNISTDPPSWEDTA